MPATFLEGEAGPVAHTNPPSESKTAQKADATCGVTALQLGTHRWRLPLYLVRGFAHLVLRARPVGWGNRWQSVSVGMSVCVPMRNSRAVDSWCVGSCHGVIRYSVCQLPSETVGRCVGQCVGE